MFMLIAAAALCGVLCGFIVGFIAAKSKISAQLAASESARQSENNAHLTQLEMLRTQLKEQQSAAEKTLQECKADSEKQLKEQKLLQQEMAQKQYDQLKAEFRVLAEKVLAEKSADLEKSGKTQLEAVITPLKVKLDEFKVNAEMARKQTNENNIKLTEQIQLLLKSSQYLGEEAGNLARALRSDNKLQGNWGEMILDEILASSGLVENVHYQKQATLVDDDDKALRNEDSDRLMRPDVLVNYPDGKVVIIDSKVSLSAYIDWVNSEDDALRSDALKRHIRSVKNHVDELVSKNYSSYIRKAKREAVDFVIMFMPNEGAYELAMRQEVKLWQEAFARKVLIVSPVNLMALLQLINLGWKRFDQERNQQRIIDTAGVLLERLYSFYKEFDAVGDKLSDASAIYRKAADRLRGGDGKHSVVKKGEELKSLGVKMRKNQEIPLRLRPEEELTLPENAEGNSEC